MKTVAQCAPMRLSSVIKIRPAALVPLFLIVPVCTSRGVAQIPDAQRRRLSWDDKTEIAEVQSLQMRLGEQVWPGFGRAKTPVILYDDTSQFLISEAPPPPPWTVVRGDSIAGQRYYHMNARGAQSFAVRVGHYWAGSLSTLESMNHKLPRKVSRDQHMAALLHEMFHAFQANQAPERFRSARQVYRLEGRYPFHDSTFTTDWDREGFLLASALRATEGSSRRRAVRDFLAVREARRRNAALDTSLTSFERELEWLEGLGKYVEIQMHDALVQKVDSTTALSRFDRIPIQDIFVLERALGHQSGDLRFYLTGMAQAQLLDELSPNWKLAVLNRGVFLEDLLRRAVVFGAAF